MLPHFKEIMNLHVFSSLIRRCGIPWCCVFRVQMSVKEVHHVRTSKWVLFLSNSMTKLKGTAAKMKIAFVWIVDTSSFAGCMCVCAHKHAHSRRKAELHVQKAYLFLYIFVHFFHMHLSISIQVCVLFVLNFRNSLHCHQKLHIWLQTTAIHGWDNAYLLHVKMYKIIWTNHVLFTIGECSMKTDQFLPVHTWSTIPHVCV